MADFKFGQTLRILLVTVSQETQDAIEDSLAGWSGEHRLYWVSQPDLAATRAQDVMPHVVLIDDALAGTNPISLIRDLAFRVPGASILALVGEEALGQARQAVLAGARGFVTKPLQRDDLVNTIRQALSVRRSAGEEPSPGQATGRIVIFCAPKGGTGRTTLAVNTSIRLHLDTRHPVILVDADYAAPALDVALSLDSAHNISDLLPRMSRLDEELISGVLAPHVSGIRVLLAPPPADLSHPISLPQVQHMLVVLKRMSPWVIVDLGLPMDDTAFGFLDAADRIVMTVLPEMVGLRNTRLMLDQLRERGYAHDKVWLVLNRATIHGGVRLRDIEERLRMKVTHQVPDDQPLATHSINRGVPLMMSHPRSAVGRAIGQLAASLAGEAPAAERREAHGLLGRRLFASRSAQRSAGD